MAWLWDQFKGLKWFLWFVIASLTFLVDVRVTGQRNTAEIQEVKAQIISDKAEIRNEFTETLKTIQKQNSEMQRTLGRIEGKVGKLAD